MKSNIRNATILVAVIVLMLLSAMYIARPNLFSTSSDDKVNTALSEIEALKNQYLADLENVKANLPPKELSLPELYEANKNATLFLWNEVDQVSGSGFFISADGILVTNYHVVENTRPNDWIVQNPDGYSYRILKVLGGDPKKDYAFLQIRNPGFDVNYLTIADEEVTIGQRCIAIGSPHGEKFTLSEGVVSQFKMIGGTQYIQNTAQIAPGSSGGPLFNQSGKVIGVTTLSRKDNSGNLNQADINYAVDIKELDLSILGMASIATNSSPQVEDDNNDFKEEARRALLDYMKFYYNRLDEGDIDAIEPMFASRLFRFYGKAGISKSEVINGIKVGRRKIKNSSTTISPDSFKIEIKNQGLELTYHVNYSFVNFNDDLSVYVLDMVVRFDEEGYISSMWEENVRRLN
jgi:S1-C subfamily serine protease